MLFKSAQTSYFKLGCFSSYNKANIVKSSSTTKKYQLFNATFSQMPSKMHLFSRLPIRNTNFADYNALSGVVKSQKTGSINP
jgi:hypothetical protein